MAGLCRGLCRISHSAKKLIGSFLRPEPAASAQTRSISSIPHSRAGSTCVSSRYCLLGSYDGPAAESSTTMFCQRLSFS
eukprot:1492871-Prymnesium_polylepis.1